MGSEVLLGLIDLRVCMRRDGYHLIDGDITSIRWSDGEEAWEISLIAGGLLIDRRLKDGNRITFEAGVELLSDPEHIVRDVLPRLASVELPG